MASSEPSSKGAIDWDSRSTRQRLEPMAARMSMGVIDLAQLGHCLEVMNQEMLGPRSSPRTMTRIPSRLLRDLSADGGLETAVRCIMDRGMMDVLLGENLETEARLRLLSAVAAALRSNDLIKTRRFALDASLSLSQRELAAKLARGLGAELELRNHEHATHILCQHPKLDADDDHNDQLPVSPHMAQGAYIHILARHQNQVLVHWFYRPDSSDLWIDADSVRGNTPLTDDPNDWSKPLPEPRKPWRIALRYLLDANKFNEWGHEPDYILPSDDDADILTRDEDQAAAALNDALITKEDGVRDGILNTTGGSSASMKKRKRIDTGQTKKLIPPSRDDDIENSVRSKRDVLIAKVQLPPGKEAAVHGAGLAVPVSIIPRIVIAEEDMTLMQHQQSAKQIKKKGPTDTNRRPTLSTNSISNIEKVCLPEWFNGFDRLKTPTKYMQLRNWILDQYKKNPDTPLTSSFCRRSLGVDASAAVRLFEFLQNAGCINNKSNPEEIISAKRFKAVGHGPLDYKPKSSPPEWTADQYTRLVESADRAQGDWKSVTAEINGRSDAIDCATRMLNAPLIPAYQPPKLNEPPPPDTQLALRTLIEARLDRLESRLEDLAAADICLNDERAAIARERDLLRAGYPTHDSTKPNSSSLSTKEPPIAVNSQDQAAAS